MLLKETWQYLMLSLDNQLDSVKNMKDTISFILCVEYERSPKITSIEFISTVLDLASFILLRFSTGLPLSFRTLRKAKGISYLQLEPLIILCYGLSDLRLITANHVIWQSTGVDGN